MAATTRIRYYSKDSAVTPETAKRAIHSEFLRNGHISRFDDKWIERNRRYLSPEQVAILTGRKLENAGKITHRHLNGFNQAIRFPEIIHHKTLPAAPHLGYCHVTAARTDFKTHKQVMWSFYIANFYARISEGDGEFFTNIDPRYARMYFAVTLGMSARSKQPYLEKTAMRPDGLLFMTHDPKVAMKNVLMLGARSHELRRMIATI